MRYLGIDFGEKRIGVAISDPSGRIAFPLEVIEVREPPFRKICEIAERYKVGKIIVGFPRSLSGRIGPQAKKVEDFISELLKHSPVPVERWDEQFTSREAERILLEMDMGRKERKIKRNAVAAALILQSYLDFIREGLEAE